MKTDITIAVCTYNRVQSLRATIASIVASARCIAGKTDILIVDNNSTDETRRYAGELRSEVPVRYVFEGKQGLSFARNRALLECSSELLLFTDDDVTVDASWVGAYLAAAGEFPDAGYFGGRISVGWPEGRPRWLRDEDLPLLSGVLDKYDLGEEVREYGPDDPLPYGASFALRRRVFGILDPFRGDLGVKGAIPGRGEETEYLERAVKAGFKGVYVGNAICHHKADLRRLQLGHLYRYGCQTGIAEVLRGRADGGSGSRARAVLFGLRGLMQLARGRGDRFRQCVINAGIQAGLRHAASKR